MLIDNNVTRFPNGVTNVNVNDIFNALRMPDPSLFHQYFEDFDYYNAANWTVTETQAGATQALTDGDGGLILLTNSAADNDINQIQKLGQSFTFTAGKKLFFRARLQGSDATNSDIVVGLQVANVDASDLTTVTDGMFFYKADDATAVSVYLRKNTTTGATTAVVTGGNMANATNIIFEAFYDGVDRLYYGYNGNIIGYLDASSTYLPDTSLAPVLEVKNGAAAAKTVTCDYIFVAKER